MALTKVGKEGVVGLDNSADATAITITSAEKVGIGISNPASYDDGGDKLVVGDTSGRSGITIVTGTSNDGSINFADGTSGTASYMGYINYHHNTNEMKLATNGGARLVIDANGHVTMPSQPAFLVRPASNQNNVAINTTNTVAFGTEVYDQNADFASNTFTAPVTGKYLFTYGLYVTSLDSAANFYESYLNTSNRLYYSTVDPDFGQDNNYFTFNLSVVADMDANDTVDVKFFQSVGTAQTDISTSSYFSGALIC